MTDPLSTAKPPPGVWFEGNRKRLLRYLARRFRSNTHDLEDVVQEAYLRLLRVERAELIRNPQAYLHQIAGNVLLESRLRAREQRPHSSEITESLTDDQSVEDQVGAEVTRRLMQQALRELPPLCQAVLYLRSQQELSNEEIAARLNVTRRMVKRHLEVGYALLRDRLSRLKT